MVSYLVHRPIGREHSNSVADKVKPSDDLVRPGIDNIVAVSNRWLVHPHILQPGDRSEQPANSSSAASAKARTRYTASTTPSGATISNDVRDIDHLNLSSDMVSQLGCGSTRSSCSNIATWSPIFSACSRREARPEVVLTQRAWSCQKYAPTGRSTKSVRSVLTIAPFWQGNNRIDRPHAQAGSSSVAPALSRTGHLESHNGVRALEPGGGVS